MAIDDRGSRFDDAIALDTFQTHGRSFIVTGGTDAGIALFELLPGGTLYHHHSTAQTLDWNIGTILSLQAVVTGDEVQILLTGAKGQGVAQMILPLDALGPLQVGTQGADSLTGAAGDDLLMGQGGDDRINGGAGADVLMAGTGQDTLTGGAGADTFVFAADGQPDTITNFEPGHDRINLDDWGMIYDISAMTIRPQDWGATLTWRGETCMSTATTGPC
ncbi:calcium-binding protein [Roseovarius sp. S1116L3]|uniref:calcium-binding protein n=1 Tax=Roseovarius roseus TaxID=3342636 RepID=UPI00372938BA